MSSSFDALGVPARLVSVLHAQGIDEPFPIQRDTLPDTLAGRDVLGRGRTGSGKTLAFALPVVARLASAGTRARAGHPTALVLAPTRELATQIAATFEPLLAATGHTVTTVFGGVSQHRQVQALQGGVDVVVACPGRLEDLMKQGHVRLSAVRVTVLDEADHMADLGFLPAVTRILAATPAGGQRLLFSATLDNGVDKLVRRFLSSPTTHSVDDATNAVELLEHAVFGVPDADAKKRLVEALASGEERTILFVRTKHVAKRLAKQLTADGIPAVDLQGNLSQAARDRNLAAFRSGEVRVLVATDVAARGVHVDDVPLVVHVDPPTEHKAYLHRSGRTARAGAAGTVVTVTLPEQRHDVATLLRRADVHAPLQAVTAESPQVRALVGQPAARVHRPAPAVQPAAPRSGAAPTGRGSRRRRGSAASGAAPRGGRTTASAGGAQDRPVGGTTATGRPAPRAAATGGTAARSTGGAAAFSAAGARRGRRSGSR